MWRLIEWSENQFSWQKSVKSCSPDIRLLKCCFKTFFTCIYDMPQLLSNKNIIYTDNDYMIHYNTVLESNSTCKVSLVKYKIMNCTFLWHSLVYEHECDSSLPLHCNPLCHTSMNVRTIYFLNELVPNSTCSTFDNKCSKPICTCIILVINLISVNNWYPVWNVDVAGLTFILLCVPF